MLQELKNAVYSVVVYPTLTDILVGILSIKRFVDKLYHGPDLLPK